MQSPRGKGQASKHAFESFGINLRASNVLLLNLILGRKIKKNEIYPLTVLLFVRKLYLWYQYEKFGMSDRTFFFN